MTDWNKLAAVAEPQHLVVATWQLRYLGVSSVALSDRITGHGWRRVHRGVTALPGPRSPLRRLAAAALAYSRPAHADQRVDALRREGRDEVTALVEAALGAGQLICGPSALWLHGLGPVSPTPWIRLARTNSASPRPGIAIRYGDATGRTAWVQGLAATDVEQAIIELPGCTDDDRDRLHHRLTKLIATADAKRLTTIDRLDCRLAEAGRVPRWRAVQDAITDLRGQLSHSATEKRARLIAAPVLERYGLQLHPRPYAVEHHGRVVGEADLAVVPLCLDLEVDGPHHLLPAQREADQARDRAVRRAGWDVERFSTELIDVSPRTFAARVDDLVRHRLHQRSYPSSAAGAAEDGYG